MPADSLREFSVLIVRDLQAHNPDIQQTRAFIDLERRNKDVLI